MPDAYWTMRTRTGSSVGGFDLAEYLRMEYPLESAAWILRDPGVRERAEVDPNGVPPPPDGEPPRGHRRLCSAGVTG